MQITFNTTLVTSGGGSGSQTATWGADTPAGEGAWKPADGSDNLADIATYDSLVSGALGAYTPTIASGALTFTGGGNGGPDGAVLRCTLVNSDTVDITISTVANRQDIATQAQLDAITATAGKTYAFRRNCQITGIAEDGQFDLKDFNDNPVTLLGEGAHKESEWHLQQVYFNRTKGIRITGINFERANRKAVYVNVGNFAITPSNIIMDGNWVRGPIIDAGTGGADEATLVSGGYAGLGYSINTFGIEITEGCENIIIRNNRFDDCWVGVSVAANHYVEFSGNWSTRAYFDHTKIKIPEGGLIYEGNFFRAMTGRTGFADGPHPNYGIQSINDNTTKTRFIHNVGNCSAQGHESTAITVDDPDTNVFHTLTGNTDAGGSTAGVRSYARGNLSMTDGFAQWSDLLADASHYENNLFLPWDRSSFPMTNTSTQYGFNLAQGADSYDFGTKVINNNVVMNAKYGGQTSTESGNVTWTGQAESWFSARFTNWTNSPPAQPSYTAAWDMAVTVAATDVDSIGPLNYFTPDTDGTPTAIDGYSINETAPTITISSAAGGAGQVSCTIGTNRTGDHHPLFWVVSTSSTLTEDEMKTAAKTTEKGYEVPSSGSASMSATGLSAGTYYIHAFQAIGAKVFGSDSSTALTVT